MKRFSLLLSLVVALPCFAGKAKAITGDECEPRFEHHWEQGCVAKSETWKERHESKLAEIKASGGTYDVVFIGDSITHRFEGVGRAVKEELEKTRRILWLGYGGDRTEQALWRCRNGELDGYRAKAVVVMIGTNNRKRNAAQIALGVKGVVKEVRARQPEAKVVLMAILPRLAPKRKAFNETLQAANKLIRPIADGQNVIWLDINDKFTSPDVKDYKTLLHDGTHPTEAGYRIWASALVPVLNGILQTPAARPLFKVGLMSDAHVRTTLGR